jgi:hypothetical protein
MLADSANVAFVTPTISAMRILSHFHDQASLCEARVVSWLWLRFQRPAVPGLSLNAKDPQFPTMCSSGDGTPSKPCQISPFPPVLESRCDVSRVLFTQETLNLRHTASRLHLSRNGLPRSHDLTPIPPCVSSSHHKVYIAVSWGWKSVPYKHIVQL